MNEHTLVGLTLIVVLVFEVLRASGGVEQA